MGGWRLSAPSPHGMGVLGGLGPPNPMGVEEPDGDPHLGVPLRAPSGGSRGVPPLGPAGGPKIVRFRGTPENPPGDKKVHISLGI